jgi:lipoprotein NlpD
MKKSYLLILLSLFMVSCASAPGSKAPVYDNSAPVADKVIKSKPASKTTQKASGKDWRPDVYTVKKGDTLYSIGLDFGSDYKEIAQNNNINPPYTIRVGQQLNIKVKEKISPQAKPLSAENDDIVIKPLNNDGADIQGQSSVASPNGLPTVNSPKATREPYSEQAYNAGSAEAKPTEVKPVEAKATDSKPLANTAEDAVDWAWPTKGKVTNSFNEGASAKGIDIEGKLGQDINAAGAGKVIYNGSDLRGYGNLVIVKHNKDYLSVYAHNSKILVKEGQNVLKGQKIAEMGNSGTDVMKLHFEIRYQGKSVDPAKFLSAL